MAVPAGRFALTVSCVPLVSLSPLSPALWSPELIASSWERQDHLDPVALRQHQNIAEWCASSKDRDEAFSALVAEACEDLRVWGAEPRGVIPCGVGSFAMAVRLTYTEGVAKWMPEPGAAQRAALMTSALQTAGLGPALLAASEHGVLLERVQPGIPVRSLPHDEHLVVAVAALLPRVRAIDPALLGNVHRVNPIAEMASAGYEDLADETDGFSARALETARNALCAVEELPLCVGHRDVQLGNVLADSTRRLFLVDADGSADAGYDDAARLVAHAAIDAWGRSDLWNVHRLIDQVAAAAQLDAGVLTTVVLAKAAGTARYIRRCVPRRAWEWQTADRLCGTLDG